MFFPSFFQINYYFFDCFFFYAQFLQFSCVAATGQLPTFGVQDVELIGFAILEIKFGFYDLIKWPVQDDRNARQAFVVHDVKKRTDVSN